MFDKIIKGISSLMMAGALYIVNDFNKDIQEKFDTLEKAFTEVKYDYGYCNGP